jgi:hypothetical protein
MRIARLFLVFEWREMTVGTDMAEWTLSVSGSLSSSDLNI